MNYWTEILPGVMAAGAMLESVDNDMNLLPEAVQVFLLVNGAQGVIDNGGYRFFFGSDWPPKTPPYDDFISAYETIGCVKQAADLRRIVATFPFSDPHLYKDKRKEFIDARYDKKTYCVPEWGDALCGDKEVWQKLAEYFELHEDEFA